MNPSFLSLSLQLLVVVSPDWNAVHATLYRYERQKPGLPWKLISPPFSVALGKQGMAWGRGLHGLDLHKKEGDERSPAGIFSLGSVFGDAEHRSFAKNMPFLLITEDLECVDDPSSLHYNRFVSATTAQKDWKSSEKMHEIGSIYALGLVVEHNLNPILAGMGSAIFMHTWSEKGAGSAGCTTMEKRDLETLISWLNKDKNPTLVQLPLEEYVKKQSDWKLPEVL